MEHYLKQNNAIDIYENYFSGKRFSSIDSDPPSAKTISIFRYTYPSHPPITTMYIIYHMANRDPEEMKRTVSHISWYPDGAHRLAAAYCSLEFQKSQHGMSLDSYIWELGTGSCGKVFTYSALSVRFFKASAMQHIDKSRRTAQLF